MNNIQEKPPLHDGLFPQQFNQNTLANKMSTMALVNQPYPSSSENFSSQQKTIQLKPSLYSVNGHHNQNHDSIPEKNGLPISPLHEKKFHPSVTSSLPPCTTGQSPLTSLHPEASILKNAPSSVFSDNKHNQAEATITSQINLMEKPLEQNLNSQQLLKGSPLRSPLEYVMDSSKSTYTVPHLQTSASASGPTVQNPVEPCLTQPTNFSSVCNKQPSSILPPSMPETNISKNTFQPPPHNQVLNPNKSDIVPLNQAGLLENIPKISNFQQSIKGPLISNQLMGTSFNQPPLPQNTSGVMSNRSNLAGQLPGQYLQNLATINENCSRPQLLEQSHNLGGSHLSKQQNLAPLYEQQNISAQVSHSQYAYGNHALDQRRFPPSTSMSGQRQNIVNTHNYLGQHSDTNYSQAYLQSYGQTGQNTAYANQVNSYQSGVASSIGGYQTNSQSQSRRLDPDQMPSPVQVIQDDQRTKGGIFITNQKGLVPPLVTTKFIVQDQGNASPRFVRSSMYTVPTTADIIKQTQIPFSIILSPMAQLEEGEFEPPIVDMGELGPVRCHRCKAYMNPYMQFIDAGKRFQCAFCKATTEVPSEYFQHLDHTGQRLDRYERPELMLGTYEFLATKDYCRNNCFPKPPAIIFIIDVSYNTIKSGLVNLLCTQMKQIIRNLPVDIGQSKSNMKVGFITYSNKVHFYNLKSNLTQPQMLIVGDVQEVFMPLLDGFLCDPQESETLIDELMAQIPSIFGDTKETEIILAPAIQAGLEALKAHGCAGKLMVFHSSLPTAEAPGKLKNRDDRKLLGTEKEKSVIAPQNNFYNNLGQDCVGAGCSVDMFIFNNSYTDISTIGQVCRLTGGELYKYTYFQAEIDGKRVIMDIMNNLSKPVAYDAVMRVRTSTGVRPVDFYGHFYMSNTTDIELAQIDSDKAIAVEIKHDDKLTEEEGVYIQSALLYTSCSGVRRLRIINLSLKTSSQMQELYRTCDLDAIINYLSKQSVFKIVEQPPKVIKDNLHSRCAAILASYRKHCASPSSAGQLILPECMKLLPLYINGLVKSEAISGGGGITIDQKSYVMMVVATMPISESIVHVYPRLLPLHEVDTSSSDLPHMLRCSIEKFSDEGAYLLENGMYMFLWLGTKLSSQWVQSVFGFSSVAQIDPDRTNIPQLDNPLNQRIRFIINQIQSERRYSMRLTITKQRDKMEMVMRQFLVEDRGGDASPGYIDFLCHMHREIRTLLS